MAEPPPRTLVEPDASEDRVALILKLACRGESDPDRVLIELLREEPANPERIAHRLVADAG